MKCNVLYKKRVFLLPHWLLICSYLDKLHWIEMVSRVPKAVARFSRFLRPSDLLLLNPIITLYKWEGNEQCTFQLSKTSRWSCIYLRSRNALYWWPLAAFRPHLALGDFFKNIILLKELAFNKVFVLWVKVIYNLGGFPFEVICLVERGSGAGLWRVSFHLGSLPLKYTLPRGHSLWKISHCSWVS